MFGERPDVVVHDGQRVLGCIVDQRHRRQVALLANKRRLDAGVHRVAIVKMNEVLFKRRERFSDLQCCQGTRYIAGNASVTIGVPPICVRVLEGV